MEYREFTGKTVEDAVMEAAIKLETTSDKLDYEILEKEAADSLESEADRQKSAHARYWKPQSVQNSSWQMFLMQWILR